MRRNALDRFETPIERRSGGAEIQAMSCEADPGRNQRLRRAALSMRGKTRSSHNEDPAFGALNVLRAAVFLLLIISGRTVSAETKLHYAPNHNFTPGGEFLPARAGFNLADVAELHEARQLKTGDRALVWIGRCRGVDKDFLRLVRAHADSQNLFGFFLMDDPDPRPMAAVENPAHACRVDNLRAESDWIHDNIPGVKTFIVLMNMASTSRPSFKETFEPSDSHVDLFGLAAYPCRSQVSGCDYDIIDRYVAAAADAGISRDQIVPIYQTFGGGGWKTDTGGQYVMPTVQQVAEIISHWRQLVPNPKMDMAYSWGTQNNDSALETAPDLQKLFTRYNRSGIAK